MATAYYGSAATPAGLNASATGVADPTAVTPPTSMLAGDLVVMIGHQRLAAAALAVSAAGGQAWNSLTAIGGTTITARVFWCTFNGTWSTDPSVDFSAATCNSVQMHVFRPDTTGYTWSVNVAQVELDIAAGTGVHTIIGQTTTGTNPTVTLAGWFTADDNQWSTTSGTGWAVCGAEWYANTSGSDQSSTYAYKIQTAAGATGNVSRTQSLNGPDASTSFIVTFAAISSDAWNVADKSAGITLSNSDKTATTTTAATAVRSTTKHASGTAGKFYAELVFDTVVSPDPTLGLKDAAIAVDTTASSVRVALTTGNIVQDTSTVLGNVGSACTSGDVVCIAWDAGAERIWFRKNNGLWNNDAAADPATGTNGLNVSSMANVNWALWMRNGNAGASRVATIRTESAEFTYTGPSGFTSWMGEEILDPGATGTGALSAQASDADGVGISESASSIDAWNTNDKSASITLSNGDKTLTTVSGGVGARSTTAHLNETAGKYYAEFLLTTVDSGVICVGIHNLSASLTSITDASCHVRTDTGAIYINNASFGGLGRALVNSDIVSVAWDSGAERIWFRLNNDDWNNSDPATGIGGHISSFAAAVNHALWFSTTSGVRVVTLRTEAAEFTQSTPSGFTSWMGETLSAPATSHVFHRRPFRSFRQGF